MPARRGVPLSRSASPALSSGDADFIVIGAGTAGCVIAARLAEHGLRVILLEAGDEDAGPLFRIPGLGFMVSLDPACNWNFETEPLAALNDRRLTIFQGKVVGGSSSINGMMYNRGSPAEFDLWRQNGCAGWAYEEIEPCFARAEARLGIPGASGCETSARPGAHPDTLAIYAAFLEAARERGYPGGIDVTSGSREGFGLFRTNICGGRRISAACAYLRPAMKTGRLDLRTRSRVRRILIDNGVAVGVEISSRGTIETLRASREVVLCAGGIKSPQLLMLSGIGPGDHLRAFGIPVLADSPLVGANFQNHASYRMQFACKAPVTAYSATRPLRAMREALRYGISRSGALSQTIFGAGGYLKSDPRLEVPDLQVVLGGGLSPPFAGGKPNLFKLLPKREGFTAIIYQGTPFSIGRVSLRSPDPGDPPRIDANYFTDHRDIEVLSEGIRRLRRIATAPALARLGVEEITPGPAVRSTAEFEASIRRDAGTVHHPSGTCAMGGHPDSVVDPQLRVRGVRRLRVADASVIPRLLNGGLHGPCLMIGEKAADLILQAHRAGGARRHEHAA